MQPSYLKTICCGLGLLTTTCIVAQQPSPGQMTPPQTVGTNFVPNVGKDRYVKGQSDSTHYNALQRAADEGKIQPASIKSNKKGKKNPSSTE